jgi:hypothetical protein
LWAVFAIVINDVALVMMFMHDYFVTLFISQVGCMQSSKFIYDILQVHCLFLHILLLALV